MGVESASIVDVFMGIGRLREEETGTKKYHLNGLKCAEKEEHSPT